jgi:hypothetical protein
MYTLHDKTYRVLRGIRISAQLAVFKAGLTVEKPSGHYMYHQFNIHKSYSLPTQCIYVFCVDLRTNGDYFPIQH